jgi:hypothetical protein
MHESIHVWKQDSSSVIHELIYAWDEKMNANEKNVSWSLRVMQDFKSLSRHDNFFFALSFEISSKIVNEN